MRMLHWSIVMICLCVSAEDVAVFREPGQNVTFNCSSAGCPSSIDGFAGMYLYHDFTSTEEVLYYHSDPSSEKISSRLRYNSRVHKEGFLTNHIITISNLTVNDSGLYRCVYTKTAAIKVNCSVHILVVKGLSVMPPTAEKCPPLVLIIIGTFVSSILLTVIFTMMVILTVKQWTSNRRRTRNMPLSSSDCVYEIMTKDGLRPLAPQQ
ncbi:uncharacterized protein [Channa argus]|uniref:uncharacterized protein n=1 Tax=Channa argus TaxID=215402 RepID=UPI003522A8B8